MSKRPLRAWGAWGLLLAAIVALLVLVRATPGGASPPPAVASAAPVQRGAPPPDARAAPTPSSETAPEEPTPREERLPLPGCWDGLLQLDQTATLESLHAVLASGLAATDRALGEYLQERLTELVGNDPERALQVVAWAETARQPELGIYLEGLKNAPAVQDPRVMDRLLRMGENPKGSMVSRSAALVALETQHHLDPAGMKRLRAIALDERVDEVAWVATRTIGRIMKEDFERGGSFQPYWDQLLDIAGKSDDTAVRLLALEMPSYSNPLIGGDSVAKLSEIMRKDRERDVREMAAFRLAVTQDTDKALEAYRTAFAAEYDRCVRWAIFRFAVRAAGANALPLLKQFVATDPRFEPDYRDFEELYASGTVDFERIWLGKKERIQCIVEEGAPH